MQVLLMPFTMEEDHKWAGELRDTGQFHLLDQTSLELHLAFCVQPDNPDLTKLKVNGTLPRLHLRFSDRKYRLLMAMVAELQPKAAAAAAAPPPAEPAIPAAVPPRRPPPPAASSAVSRQETRSMRSASFASAISSFEPEVYKRHTQPSGDMLLEEDETEIHFFHTKQELALPIEVRVKRVLLAAAFSIDLIAVTVAEWDANASHDRALIELRIRKLAVTEFTKRSFDMHAVVSLAGIDILDHCDQTNTRAYVLRTSEVNGARGK
jgi:hypothetical protein